MDTVNSVETEQVDVQKQYPTIFKGLGVLGDKYKNKLREGAVPHALFT